MKKTLVVLVLMVFLLSSLPVLAEEGSGKYGIRQETKEKLRERISADDNDDDNKNVVCPADVKTCPDGKTFVSRNTKRNCAFDPCPGEQEASRGKVKEHLEKAKERKKDISDAAKELKERCKAKETTEGNCGKAFEKIKEHLNKVVDRMIEAFTNLKNRFSAATDVDKQNEVISKIDGYLAELKALQTKIDAAKTREELKAVMKEVREKWVVYKQFIHEQRERFHFGRARSLLAKAERVHDVLDALLERLKQQGGSDERIQAIETALQAVDAKVEVVKQAIAQQNKDVVKSSLKELHELLKEVIHRFRQAGKGNLLTAVKVKEAPVASTETTETELEEEEDEA